MPADSDMQKNRDLTKREASVMEWVIKGKTTWEIAKILNISERTVKFHLTNTYAKLRVTNRTHATSVLCQSQNDSQLRLLQN